MLGSALPHPVALFRFEGFWKREDTAAALGLMDQTVSGGGTNLFLTDDPQRGWFLLCMSDIEAGRQALAGVSYQQEKDDETTFVLTRARLQSDTSGSREECFGR